MLAFIIIMVVLEILSNIKIGEYVQPEPQAPPIDSRWNFKTLDDCMEFHELRATGWKGNAIDFYKWREED